MTDRAKVRLVLAAAAAASTLIASKGSAQVLYEPFSYGNNAVLDSGSNVSTSGTTWNARGTQAADITTVTGSLGAATVGTVPPLPGSIGRLVQFPNTTTGLNRVADINFGQTFTTPGDYYYSLTLKAPSTLTTGAAAVVAGFSNFSIATPATPGLMPAGLRVTSTATNFQLGMASGGQNATSATLFNPGDTVFVVARYTIVAGNSPNNDQVALWINPTSGFGDNNAIPAPTLSFTHTASDAVDAVLNNPMLAGFILQTRSSAAGFQFDELRVDKTWAGVTPNGNLQYTWNTTSGGNISDTTWNKLGGAPSNSPNGAGHVANFGSGITTGSSFTSAGETLDTIAFTNTGSLTVNGTGLTMQTPAANVAPGSPQGAAQIVAYSGTHTISAPLTMGSDLSIKTQGATTSVTLGNTVTGTKSLGVYGTGTVKLGASNLIDDAASLEVRSGTFNLNTNSETVGKVLLGTSHPNNGSAIGVGVTYNGDLASGTISNGTITSNNFDLRSGTISAVVAGTNGVAKNESGVVTLSGNNTYTGDTVVNQGVLKLTGTNSNPIAAKLNVPTSDRGSTATLLISTDSNLGASGSTVTFTSTGGQSGTLHFGDNMTLAADRSVVANAALSRLATTTGKIATLNAPISGTGGINVTYPWDPTVVSSGDNSQVSPGPVHAGAWSTIGGTVVLNSTNNTYPGNTTVSGGRLLLPSKNNLPAGVLGTPGKIVTIMPPDFPNTNGNTTTRLAPTSIGGVVSVAYGGPSDWTDADVETLRNNTVTWGTSVTNFNTAAPSGTFLGLDTTNATGPVTTALTFTSGNYGISKHGAGTLNINTDISLSGNILGDGGIFNLTGNLTNAGTNAGIIYTTSGTTNISGNVNTGGAVRAFGGTLNITGNLNNGGIVNAAGATVILSGNNGYAGQTLISGNSTLIAKSSTALGTTAGNTFVSGGSAGDANSTLQIDGTAGPLTIAEPIVMEGKTSGGGGNPTPHINNTVGNNTLTGAITLATSGSWYNISATGGKLTIAGTGINNALTGATLRQLNFRGAAEGVVTANITNSGSASNFAIQKFDSGTWTFSGTNSWTGNTTINTNGGRMQFTIPGALPNFATSGKTIVNSGGTLGVNVGGAGEWDTTTLGQLLGAATFNAGSAIALDSTNATGTFTHAAGVGGLEGVTKLGAGTVALTGTNTYTGGTRVNAGTLQMNRLHENNAVNIQAGTLQVLDSSPTLPSFPSGQNSAVSRPGSMITIANDGGPMYSRVYNGTLDLGNNDLIVDYTGSSPFADVQDMVRSGFNFGDWFGKGITSSTAANPLSNGNYALGVAENGQLTNPFGADDPNDPNSLNPQFDNQTVDNTTVLVKFTHRVDLDLNGLVDGNDAAVFNGSFSEGDGGATWQTGDVDYDGVYSSNDAAIFNSFYDESLAHLPEPGAIGLLGGLGLTIFGRRRRT